MEVVAALLIYGGTAGGFTAALEAASLGVDVVLVEPSGHIGGMSVEGLGGSDIDNHAFKNSPAVGGLALEFYRRIARAYGRTDPAPWRFESRVAEAVIDAWLAEYPIRIYRNTRLSEAVGSVQKDQERITSLTMEDGRVFRAQMFIDATIEGDLLARSGVSTTVGREANSVYHETKNGIRAQTTHAQFSLRIDPYRIPGDPSSGVIPTVQDEPLGTPGEGDRSFQAYCFRVCLTKNPDNRVPFVQPMGYDRNLYEIYLRYLRAGGKLYTPQAGLPGGKTDLGAWHDLSHNLYGMNRDYPEGDYATRKRVYQEHRDFTQGLFYFFANDEEVGRLAPALQAEWRLWGLAADEFGDNDHWPRQFYVRDARRMVSDCVITEHYADADHLVPDPVGLAFWPMDVHSVRRIVRDGAVYNEGFVFDGRDARPLPIPYRALVPRKSECSNLLTPTCVSSSHIAYGAIRLEWTFMLLGQSCGAAAALALEKRIAVQDLMYAELQARLLKSHQVLSLPLR